MKAEYERLKVEENSALKFTRLCTIEYKAKNTNESRKWEMIQRTTRTIPLSEYQRSPAPVPIDAVEICATLRRENLSFLILVLQYRPPLDSLVLEFPAGLIDPNESPETATIRELREETGYFATEDCIEYISPPIAPEPGLSDTCARLVKVNVDGTLPVNVSPEQELDDGEDIEVVLIPISPQNNILNSVNEFISAKGKMGLRTVVDAKLFSYLVGLESSG